MNKSVLLVTVALLAAFTGFRPAAGQQRSTPPPAPAVAGISPKAILDQYCVGCHSERGRAGGLALEKLDPSNVAEHAETWEKVVRRVRAGMMPPINAKRPDAATLERFASTLETDLDKAAAVKPALIAPGIHRVNRVEYANAIKELLNLEIDPAGYLPVDDASYGFDNVASGQSISPALVEGFLTAASKVARVAVGHETGPQQKKYVAPQDYSQEGQVEGLPLGTRGGMLVRHYFPADGEYVISWFPVRGNTGELYGANRKGEKLEVNLDGQRLKLFEIDKIPQGTDNDKNEVRAQIKAGMHEIGLAFLATTQVPIDDLNQHYVRSVLDTNPIPGYIFSPQVSQVWVMGPYEGKRPQNTPSRAKIFTCRPATGADEVPCVKKIMGDLGKQAYRRPLNDGDMENLLTIYQKGRNQGDFEDGIQLSLEYILADPEFLFRAETDPANLKPGEAYRISDLELASRMAFFLWSAPPDAELINLAAQNKLRDPATLERQVTRMLSDPRSHELVKNFGGQWLQLRNLPSASPVTQMFPDFDDNLRQAFRTETEMLLESIVRENRNVLDLLNADYTFVNERLARHYGIPNIYGSRFRKVELGKDLDARRGLLGQGSIQLITSIADRTSPVQRGKWVLVNLLGIVPPDPPAEVPPLKTSTKMNNGQPAEVEETMRARMEEHRANPACASCHMKMDPIGFALENFDAVGKWRTTQWGKSIDVSGFLSDGVKLNGPTELRQQLLKYSPQILRNFTEKLMTYALGRGTEYYDMPTVRAIVRDAGRSNNKFSLIALGIIKSAPFQMNRKAEDSQTIARK